MAMGLGFYSTSRNTMFTCVSRCGWTGIKSGQELLTLPPHSSRNGIAHPPIDRRRFIENVAGVGAMVSLSGSAWGQVQTNSAFGAAQTTATSVDCRLPDGTAFVQWEQPLTFSKTYFVDNTSRHADDNGPGNKARPFRTISKAVQLLQPGERVVIAAGTYRECVRPMRGGTSPTQMIS
jgi:hypothetical protein